ncbi:MAG: bifunctional folylpolyglutamate synthase/dihydrofolate synthase, partial [Symploca sp. SIO2C1]|nr:bifunctional folylpolyglutamate synthase/dihydrofolate synthase [Symploca sp. SIO2C1]
SEDLGTTFSEIATDKAGIASPNSTLVLGSDIPESALKAILEDAQRRSIEIVSPRSKNFQVQSLGIQGHQVTTGSKANDNTFILPLVGSFQLENLATAKAAFDLLISKHIIDNQQSFFGVSQVRWQGRMELIPGNPNWLLDAAHNTHAIAKITADLPKLAKDKEVAILLGLSDHNDLADLAPYLNKLGEATPCSIYLTSGFYRSIEPCEYISIFKNESSKVITLGNYKSAIDKLVSIYHSKENALIFVTGSLFLVGAARDYILLMANG